MTYFELVIACFIGVNIEAFLPENMLTADKLTLVSQRFANCIIAFFPVAILVAIWLEEFQV